MRVQYPKCAYAVNANYIGPLVMTDANCEGFPSLETKTFDTFYPFLVIIILRVSGSWPQTAAK